MIRFHQTFGAHAGRVTELDKEKISFGRMPDCDVAFDPQADLDASGRHAEVVKQGGDWHVIDAGSRNGTWLNGQKVQRAVLSSGDEIEFGMGGPRVRVEIVSGASDSGRQITGPMTPTPGEDRPGQPTAAATPVPEGLGQVDASAPTMAAMATPTPVTPPRSTPGFEDPPTNAATPNALGTAGDGGGAPPGSSPGQSTPIAGGVGPGPGGGAPPASPPGSSPKQYGERTVGLMIQAAIAQQAAKTPKHKSTEEIRAIAMSARGGDASTGAGLKLVVAILVFLIIAILVASGFAYWYYTRGGGATEGDGAEVDTEAAALSISTQNSDALFVLLEVEGETERGICAAFAVRSDLLATSAQCVLAMQEGRARRATHVAVPNGGGGQRLSIDQMWHHPNFRPGEGPSADVGIVQTGGTLSREAPLASMGELAELEADDPVFLYGFSGDLSNVSAPVAGVATGRVRGITAFDGSEAPLATAQLILHDIEGSPGTRGSPIFDASGRVVAIDEGGHAVRIDLLASLLAGLGR